MNKEILEKIEEIYKITDNYDGLWVEITYLKNESGNNKTLTIHIYTFVIIQNVNTLAYVVNEKIALDDKDIAIIKLDYMLEQLHKLLSTEK